MNSRRNHEEDSTHKLPSWGIMNSLGDSNERDGAGEGGITPPMPASPEATSVSTNKKVRIGRIRKIIPLV